MVTDVAHAETSRGLRSLSERTLVVIPTAGQVPPELVPFTQSRHSALIRLQRKPVIFWTMEYLLGLGFDRFSFAVGRRPNDAVECFVQQLAGWRSQLVFARPDRDAGLVYSVYCALRESEPQRDRFDRVLLVLGDTYFRFPPADLGAGDRSFILTGRFDPSEDRSEDWCLVRRASGSGVAEEYVNKQPGLEDETLGIVAGIYFLRDARLFMSCVEAAVAAGEGELHTALARYQEVDPIECVDCAEWYDCGHLPNLLRSEQKMVQERSFNEVTLDKVRGIVTKRSSEAAKLRNEIAYYESLPKDLRCLFPRILDADLDEPWVALEFYGYPSLSDHLVFNTLHLRIWELVFHKLHSLVQLFRKELTPPRADGSFLGACRSMYVDKTRDRLERLRREDVLWREVLGSKELVLNGRVVRNVDALLQEVERCLPSLVRAGDFSLIHGDLCFSNILYDLPTGTCRLIDPRGSFGEPGNLGDIKYDVAKLYHSVDGLYDFIINDLFSVDYAGAPRELTYRIYFDKTELKARFEQAFFAGPAFSQWEILVIEGLLFLSMLPLHTESRSRQFAMFATGLERLETAFS